MSTEIGQRGGMWAKVAGSGGMGLSFRVGRLELKAQLCHTAQLVKNLPAMQETPV